MFAEKEFAVIKQSLTIDMLLIDEDLIRHPMLMQEAAECTAAVIRVRDAVKNELDVETARAASRLREPTETEKAPSETKIASLVILDKNVIKKRAEYDDTRYDAALWQGLAEAVKEKGSSLKRISELIIAGYLAPDKVRREQLSERRRERL